MRERNLKAVVAYDGTGFFGWQVQPARRTTQGVLEETLCRLLGEKIRVHAAGRTDRGVHANGQVVSFLTRSGIPSGNLKVALNAMLPSDIFIKEIDEASPEFHARYSAVHRTYRYRLGLWGQPRSPFTGRYCWYPRDRLDFHAMKEASRYLRGNRDFRSFSKRREVGENTFCKVESAFWQRIPAGYAIVVTADRFLPQMMRRLVAALIDIGSKRCDLPLFEAILSGRKEDWPRPWVAPPQGLFLESVGY